MDALLRRAVKNAEISPLSGSDSQAAVAIVLSGEDRELLLIRRAEHPDDPWSGHMALPGGRLDPSDHDLLETAIRETAEEVGISLLPHQYVGSLPPTRARSRTRSPLWVTPFVFRLEGPRPQVVPNYEVAEALWLPLADLTAEHRATSVELSHGAERYRFPAWEVEGKKVWGLTYMILSQLLGLMTAARVQSR